MKAIATTAVIEIKDSPSDWIDISSLVTGWDFSARVGELWEIDLHLRYDRNHVWIENSGGYADGKRVPINDVIIISGVNLSDHISSYSVVSSVGEVEKVILRLQCDADVLRINGVHPWVPNV